MEEELIKIIRILKIVFPKLRDNPEIMRGCDVSEEEIEEILKNKLISLEVMGHLSGDGFFKTYNEELTITSEEGIEIDEFLFKTAEYFYEELKKEFPYLLK